MRVGGLRRVARLLCVTVLSAGLPTAAVIAGAVLPKAEAAGAAMTCVSSPGGAIALDGTSHCGLLETQGAENDWTFTVAAPGTQAWFDMPDPEGCTCRQWSLRDSKNHYAFTATTNRYVGHVFLAPASYTLTVTTLSPLRPSNLYYTFKAWSEPAANSFNVTAPFTVTGSADPTQSTITQGAGTPQVNSGAGNLEQPGAVDVYNITIPAGGARVVLQATSGRNGARNIVLRDMAVPTKPRVIIDQRFGDVPAMPLAQGAYQLTIGSYTQATYPFDAPGPYSFKFLVLTTPVTYNVSVPFTVTTDAINGVTRTGAGTVTQIGEQDIYKFDLAAQTRVTLHPCGAASVPMTYALYDPNGMVVTTTNSCNTDTVLDLAAGNGYQLVGMSSDLGLVDAAAGSYALSMTLGGTTATTVRPFGTGTPVVPSGLPAPGVALPMVGTIPAAGTVDVYSFTATAGQRIILKVNGNNTGLKMQLHGPGGLIVLLGGVQVGDVFSAYEDPYTLVDTGTYAFSVYAGSGTGAYNLSIYAAPAADQPTVQLPTATKYPVTIADGTQTNPASTTTPPATLPLAGAGNISKEGEQDLYRLNATKGQRLSFSYVNTANSLSLIWNILGPNGLEIAESRSATKVAAFFTTVVVPVTATGIYTVAMYASDSSKGTYSFQISLLPAAVPFEVTAPGVFLDPAHPVSITKDAVGGVTATGAGTIEVPGNVDEYTFSARAGQLLFLPDPGMTLYGVNGAAIPRIADPVSSDFIPAPRSGVYTMVISAGYLCCSNRIGDYSLTIGVAPSAEKFGVSVPFTVTGGATRATSTITDGAGTRTVAGAGFIEQAGSRDIYTFQGTGGDQLVIPNSAQINATFDYTLLGPDGFVVDTGVCSGNCTAFTLPRSGFYTLEVHRQGVVGAYAISVTRTAGTPPVVPQTQTFDALPGDSVTPNAPQVGAGLIEANADEQYLIDAVSGDAIDIQLMHSDPAQRASVVHGVPVTRLCGGGDNVNLSWNLRDPDGNVIFENRAVRYCSTTDVGAIVLGRTGTYTLTIGGATVLDTFDLTMPRVPRIGEVPQPGQAPPPPALTSVDPATGTAGHFTTFSVYGANLPTPTAAHVTSTVNGTQLPATLREAHSVHGSVPALAAGVEVDLTNAAVAVPGNYAVRLDLTGGGSVTLAAPNYFVVHAASSTPPKLDITTLGLDRVRWGGMTRAYINVSNPNDTDMAAHLSIPIPAEVGVVKLVTPINRAALIADMRAAGATDAQVAAANVPDQVKTSPTTDANGNTTLAVNSVPVVAGHSATLELEITAPAQPAGTSAFATSANMAVAAAATEPPPTTTGCLTAQKIVKTIITTTTYLDDGWQDAFKDFVKDWLEQHTDLPDYVRDMAANVATLSVEGLDAVVLYAVVLEVVGTLALVFGIATGAYAALASLAGAAAFIAAAAAFKEEWTKTIEVTELYVYWVVSNACDPNALIGPGTPTKVSVDPAPVFLDGGKILANTRANYEAEFENMGGLPAQLVEVDVPLSNQLDWNSFRLESVRVGSTDVPMTATGTWSARGQATVPLDATTTALVTVTSQFRPDTGSLTVLFAGPVPTDAHPLSPYGDFLPPNTTKPEGEGFVRYSAKVKNLPLGSYVTQTPATIKFDGHLAGPPAPLNTNSWRNMIGVDVPAGDHLIPGRVLKLTDNPLATSARVVQMTLVDPALTAMKDPHPNGMTIRVKSEAGDKTYLLDPRGWIASPSIGTARVYKYRDTHHLYGPIMTATLDVAHGKVKIKGRGANLGHSLVTMPTAVDIVIVDNGDRWCARFGGTLSLSVGKKFLGKNAPAPSACAA